MSKQVMSKQSSTKATMRALMMTEIGKLELQTLPRPELVRPDDVLLEVKAAGICGSDLHGYTGASGRRTPPLIMGHEATGQVVAVGEAVRNVAPGERVAIMPLTVTNGQRQLMGMDAPGAYATHVTWPAERLFPLPDTLSYDAGAFAEPLAVALHAAGVAHKLAPAFETAFIAGAGTIGLLIAVALQRAGVKTLISSDVSEARLQVAQKIGVTHTLSPQRDNVLERVLELTDGRGADLTIEAVGISATVGQSLEVVKNGGVVVWVGNNHRLVEVDMQAVVTRELSVLGSYGLNDDDFVQALELLASGRVPTEVLTSRRASLREGVHVFDELLASPETIKCLLEPEWD